MTHCGWVFEPAKHIKNAYGTEETLLWDFLANASELLDYHKEMFPRYW